MIDRVTVTALTAVTYRGQDYQRGELFEARPAEAAALHYQRKVSLTRPSRTLETRVLTPDPDPPKKRRGRPRKVHTDDSPPPRRTYQRRDLVPEP